MADTAAAALVAAPSPKDLERARAFTLEPFLLGGEDPADALAPGTPRRKAFDAAIAELEAGATHPSREWRRTWALLLGLERVLSEDEPKLVDGTTLSAHQVDALSGTLTALLAETQRNGNGNGAIPVVEDVELASPAIPGEEALLEEEDEPDEEPQDWSEPPLEEDEEVQLPEQPEDPNAHKRFWFEHATGAGKTVAALGFVEASRTGGILILTHRRNLVDQFLGELNDRGYKERIAPPLLGDDDRPGAVTVETYQWYVRNAGNVSGAYTIVICDEAHTALGEKTSGAIRNWAGPIFIGMTATGALIARHVTDLFPTQTSRFDLAQAARRGVIAPLRCVRIPPGPGVRTIAKVPLRKGEVDMEFDQEMLAELLDQAPFNLAVADLYKTRFNNVPGVVYAAGVKHAYNVAESFRMVGLKAQGVSGETPKRELAEILAAYERGEIDVLVNAQLLAEGWNSPRATVCMHLAPTASRRIYQQRVGRVTRRHPGKEAGIVVDFVHPATKHDDPVVTLHSLLDRDVYRGGAIVVGPVRRGRGRRLRVERRVVPVTAEENRRIEVYERELWRIAVEHLDYGEQIQWAALAGARVASTGWRRARAMLHFDTGGELKRAFLLTALQRNKNAQLRLRALQEIAVAKDAEAFDEAIEIIGGWPRDERREAVKVILTAIAEKKLGRRDQANNWIWRCAEYTRDAHEEYAVQRWPETKRLLGLLVNSSGGAHARNARRLVQSARNQDRRLSAALLAAAVPHTAEAGEVINGARMRMSRKPGSLARELLRNLPKGKGKRRRTRKKKDGEAPVEAISADAVLEGAEEGATEATPSRSRRSRRRRSQDPDRKAAAAASEEEAVSSEDAAASAEPAEEAAPRRTRGRSRSRSRRPAEPVPESEVAAEPVAEEEAPKPRRARARKPAEAAEPVVEEEAPKPRRTRAKAPAEPVTEEAAPKPRRTRAKAADAPAPADEAPAPKPRGTRTKAADAPAPADEAASPKPRRTRAKAAAEPVTEEAAPKPRRTRAKAAAEPVTEEAAPKPRRTRATAADAPAPADEAPTPKPRRTRAKAADAPAPADEAPAPKPRRTRAKAADAPAPADEAPAPKSRRTRAKAADAPAPADETPAPKPRRTRAKPAAEPVTEEAAPKPRRTRAKAADTPAPAEEAPAPKPRRTRAKPAAADAPADEAPKPRRTRARKPPPETEAA